MAPSFWARPYVTGDAFTRFGYLRQAGRRSWIRRLGDDTQPRPAGPYAARPNSISRTATALEGEAAASPAYAYWRSGALRAIPTLGTERPRIAWPIAVRWSLACERRRLIVTDIGRRLPPATPGGRRLQTGVKYHILIFGAFGESVARRLSVTLIDCRYGDAFAFSRRSIFQIQPYRQVDLRRSIKCQKTAPYFPGYSLECRLPISNVTLKSHRAYVRKHRHVLHIFRPYTTRWVVFRMLYGAN